MDKAISYARSHCGVWTRIEESSRAVVFRVYEKKDVEDAYDFAASNGLGCDHWHEQGLYGPRIAIELRYPLYVR